MESHKIILPIGLPGSGKTHLGKEMCNEYNYKYLDIDYMFGKNLKLDEVLEEIKINVRSHKNGVYLDGLFIPETTINEILDLTKYFENLDIEVIYWGVSVEDRNNCISNDKLRNRKLSSVSIIENSPAPFCPNEGDERISKLIIKSVKNYNYLDTLKDKIDFYSTTSQEYILEGSTYGTCWDENGPSELTPDLNDYDLLEEDSFKGICSMLDLQVKDLTQETVQKCRRIVDEIEDSELDWYGGCKHYVLYDYNLEDMIRIILKYQFGVEYYSEEYIKDKLPERFLFG